MGSTRCCGGRTGLPSKSVTTNRPAHTQYLPDVQVAVAFDDRTARQSTEDGQRLLHFALAGVEHVPQLRTGQGPSVFQCRESRVPPAVGVGRRCRGDGAGQCRVQLGDHGADVGRRRQHRPQGCRPGPRRPSGPPPKSSRPPRPGRYSSTLTTSVSSPPSGLQVTRPHSSRHEAKPAGAQHLDAARCGVWALLQMGGPLDHRGVPDDHRLVGLVGGDRAFPHRGRRCPRVHGEPPVLGEVRQCRSSRPAAPRPPRPRVGPAATIRRTGGPAAARPGRRRAPRRQAGYRPRDPGSRARLSRRPCGSGQPDVAGPAVPMLQPDLLDHVGAHPQPVTAADLLADLLEPVAQFGVGQDLVHRIGQFRVGEARRCSAARRSPIRRCAGHFRTGPRTAAARSAACRSAASR